MKNCPNCGALNNNEASFCLQCGANLIQANNMINNNIVQPNNINSFNSNNIELNTQDLSVSNNPENPKGSNKNLIIIAIIIGVIVAIIIGILLFKGINKDSLKNENQNSEVENEEKLKNPKSFIISLSNGLNAMFDENGEQYTDFIYSSLYGSNGVYKAELNDSKKIQILDDKGNVIFEPNDNVEVDLHSGYFFVKNKEMSTGEVFNKDGKVLLTGVTEVFSDYFPNFILYLKSGEYHAVNGDFEEIFFLEKSEDETRYPIVDHITENVVTLEIFKERQTLKEIYFFDTEKKEQIMKLDILPGYDYETHFGDNYEKIIFTLFDKYILYENGIQKYERNKDDYGVKCEFEFLEDGTLICSGNTSYFVNEDGSIKTEMPLLDVEFIDKDNYATYDDDSNTTTIYSNGIPTVYKCWESPKASKDVYLLSNYPYGECNLHGVNYNMIVKKDGTKIMESPTIDIVSDGNFTVITTEVLEDFSLKYTAEFYDSNGNKIKLPINQDEELSSVSLYNDDMILIKIRNKDKGLREVLMDRNGKVLLEDKNIVYLDLDGIIRIYTYENKGEYKIYNSETFKYITTVTSEPMFMSEYFISEDKEVINYYSYVNGKKFYSYKK